MIVVRPLDWPGDRAPLARLDTAFDTGVVYDVCAGPLDFALVECPADPPLHKRYHLPLDELAAAAYAVVAERAGQVVGVAALTVEAWNRSAVLSHLYVDRGARRGGAGAALLADVRRRAAALGAGRLRVETQNVNAPAIRFYRRHGFVCCGVDTALYDPRRHPGEAAVFLALPLDVLPLDVLPLAALPPEG